MNDILFEIPNNVTEQDVISKMNYFKKRHRKLMVYSKPMLLTVRD